MRRDGRSILSSAASEEEEEDEASLKLPLNSRPPVDKRLQRCHPDCRRICETGLRLRDGNEETRFSPVRAINQVVSSRSAGAETRASRRLRHRAQPRDTPRRSWQHIEARLLARPSASVDSPWQGRRRTAKEKGRELVRDVRRGFLLTRRADEGSSLAARAGKARSSSAEECRAMPPCLPAARMLACPAQRPAVWQ